MLSTKIYRGDCLKLLPNVGSVSAIVTDPPYGRSKQSWDHAPDTSIVHRFHELAGPTGNVVIFSQQPVASDWITRSPQTFRYELIWQKTHPVGWLSSGCRPLRSHENILVFVQRFGNVGRGSLPGIYNPQFSPGRPYKRRHIHTYTNIYAGKSPQQLNGHEFTYKKGRHPTSILTFPRDGHRGTFHPNAKPVALMTWLIKTYSRPGDTVLDPFMGSGTTGVACVLTGRHFIGIEKDRRYFRIAQKRIAEARQSSIKNDS